NMFGFKVKKSVDSWSIIERQIQNNSASDTPRSWNRQSGSSEALTSTATTSHSKIVTQ
ncbi:unnamed protein product, partial [Rhizopus stolonifer]